MRYHIPQATYPGAVRATLAPLLFRETHFRVAHSCDIETMDLCTISIICMSWDSNGAAPLFGLAPGGVYPATTVASGAVRSYRTISPLPARPERQYIGGMFSVALSVGSRPPGITWHPALWSPDFPLSRRLFSGTTAIAQPTPWVTRYLF
jgi:hypothetical protein